MQLSQLSSEQLEIIRSGAAPLEASDRGGYFDHVAALLRERDPPSNRAIADVVQQAQKQFNRALARAKAGIV
jgi:hypothetical protein